MPKISGSSGNVVNYELRGIRETIDMLRRKGIEIKAGQSVGLVQAGNYVENEVKQSVAGRRAELKSVDSGNFLNSIEVTDVSEDSVTISSDVSYAKFLEYGTSRLVARRHFANTKSRSKSKVKNIVDQAIKTETVKTASKFLAKSLKGV